MSNELRLSLTGSGFYDRAALLNRHRHQRDQLRRHVRDATNRDVQRIQETSIRDVVELENPFQQQSGLGIPADGDDPGSRPWTAENGPEVVDVPTNMIDYEDPYDPEFAAEMEAKYGPSMMPHAAPPPPPPPPLDPAVVDERPSEVLASLRQLQLLLREHDEAQTALEDEDEDEERRFVKVEIDRRIAQLTELQLHIEQFMNRNAHTDAELAMLLQRRDVEMAIIQDTMNSLGQRQSSELIMYQWDQELKRREDRSAKALAKQLRVTRDVACGTVTPLPEIEEPIVVRPRQRKASIRRASLFGADVVTPLSRVNSMQQSDSGNEGLRSSPTDAPGSTSARAKFDRSVKVARTLSMFTRNKKPEEDPKSDSDVVDFEAEAARIRKIVSQHPPPSGTTTVFVHLCVKHAEVFDAWEREYSAFMISTVRTTRFIVQQAEEFRGYVIDFGRFHYDLAFGSEGDAIQCVMHIQAGLVNSLEYVPALLRFRGTAVVADPKFEARTIFKGVRLAGGMHSYDADEARPWRLKTDYDAFTRRLRYIGPEATVARQLAEMARGGEVLVTANCWASMKERAPLQVFTTVVVKEFHFRITPEEARQTALGAATTGLMDDGCYALPICSIFNFEQQNRRLILGPNPREFNPNGSGGADNQTSNHALSAEEERAGSVPSTGNALEATPSFVLAPATASGAYSNSKVDMVELSRMGLNVRALRASADNTHATFVVVCVPLLGKLLQIPGGAGMFDMLKSMIQRGIDHVNNAKRTFFSRSVGQLNTVLNGDGFDTAGIISANFDEISLMFKTEVAACQWILTLHEELQHMDCPLELAEFNKKHFSEQPAEHWGGLRIAVGVGSSVPTISFHRSTGLYVYDGPGLMTARELALTARGGETLIPGRFVDVLNLRGIPKYEYVVECINSLKTAKENWIYSLYSKAFAQRRLDLGPLRQDLLIKLSSNLNEIKNSNLPAFGQVVRKVTAAALNQSKRTDVFLAAAHKLATSHQGFDAAVRAVSTGIVDDRVAEVLLQLLRQGEKQGVVDKSVLDEAEPPKELPPDDEELKEKAAVAAAAAKYTPNMAASEVRNAQPSRWAKVLGVKIDEFKAIELPGKRKTRAVLTQTNFEFLPGDPPPTIDGRAMVKATPSGAASSTGDDERNGDGDSSRDESESDEGRDDEDAGGVVKLPRARARKHRKVNADGGDESPKFVYMTEAERLQAKESKWKALHKAMQEKRGQGDAVAEATKALALKRTEQRLQLLVEQKLKAEERRNKRKEAWKVRQEAKKEALKEVIQRKLKELVLRQEKFVTKTERFKNVIKPDETPVAVSIFVDHGSDASGASPRSFAIAGVSEDGYDHVEAPVALRSPTLTTPPTKDSPSPSNGVGDTTVTHLPAPPASGTQSSPRLTAPPPQSDRSGASLITSPTVVAGPAPATATALNRSPNAPAAAWEPSPPRADTKHPHQQPAASRSTLTSPVIPRSASVDVSHRQPSRGTTASSNTSTSPSLTSSAKLTATALAHFAAAAADELTKAALDRLSLSSMDSSLMSMLAEDEEDQESDGDDSGDMGSDVEELLVAAGLKEKTPSHAAGTSAHKAASRWERKAKKLVKEAMVDDAKRSSIPTKVKGIQCDLGPRVIVKKELVAPPPKRSIPIATFATVAPTVGGASRRGLNFSEDDGAAQKNSGDTRDGPRSPTEGTATKAFQPSFAAKKQQQATPAAPKPEAPTAQASQPDLVIQAADLASLVMQDEAKRVHDDEDEELSYLIHLAQRRDVIADFRDIVVTLSAEGHEFLRSKSYAGVPGLARRCALTLVAPIMHYLEQLLATQAAGAERAKTADMLQSVRKYEVEERSRRRRDAQLQWLIAATRYSAEIKTKRAMTSKTAELHRAKIAVVAAMLKKLTVLKDLHRREREGRLALMVNFLDDVFDGRIANLPQVDANTELPRFSAPAPVIPAVTNVINTAPSAAAKQQTRRANAAAYRAAGISAPRKVDTAGYAALQSLLHELDPTLSLMPNIVNPDFDPETGAMRPVPMPPAAPAPLEQSSLQATSAELLFRVEARDVPPHHTSAPDVAGSVAAPRPSPLDAAALRQQVAAAAVPRHDRAINADFVVGKVSEDERRLRIQTRQIEFLLKQSETDKAAHNLDNAAPGVRAVPTVPAFDPNRPATEHQYREWIGDLNARIADHTKSLLQRDDAPPPLVGNVVVFGTDPRSRPAKADTDKGSALPPVRGAPKGGSKSGQSLTARATKPPTNRAL